MGQAMHTILERGGVVGQSEERLYADIGGMRVSGQFDYIDDEGLLWDWKFVSVWEVMNGVKESREQQLNAYAYLAAANGKDVTGLRVGFIFRDWKRSEATQSGYPPHQVLAYPIALHGIDETRRALEARVTLHHNAQTTLAECTPEERWARPDTYAVIKSGNKRASKVFDDQHSAATYQAAKGTAYSVHHRTGENVRCESYCSVAKFCEQFQKLKRA
jgi:hypothetical protein